MWWRPKVIQWTILSTAIASGIVLILVTLMLLPSITDGPDAVHYLERSECILHNITYLDNYCPRDSSGDFSNLKYENEWPRCKIIMFNSTSDLNIDCYWLHPGSYKTEQEAFIAVSENYQIGMKYDCVLNTIQNICHPDKKELLIFSLTVSSLFILTVLIIIAFCFLRLIVKK